MNHRVYLIWREGQGSSGLHSADIYTFRDLADNEKARLDSIEKNGIGEGFIASPRFTYTVVPARLVGDLTSLEKV